MTSYTKWKSWDENQFGLTSKENLLYYKKLFSRYLPEAKNVLEIGYGNGSFLNWCKEKDLNVHGIEQDKDLIARAKKLNYKVYKSISEIKQTKFDLIVLFDVLEHIEQKKIDSVFKSLKKILAKNGKIFIRVPNGSSPFGLANQHGDITHMTTINGAKIAYWSKFNELKVIYSGGDVKVLMSGKLYKMPQKLIRRFLQIIIEELIRFIFSPLPRGVLSANLLCILSHEN
jgi:2-polyprenyl-3-methyl-5-hydroxy-6-metoxy-1,4-benzoquinol methylase